jgi:cytochrome P450
MFFSVFGQHIMILSSEKRMMDLFERRSAIYSGRPHSVMMHELFVPLSCLLNLPSTPLRRLEFDNFFAVLDYGPFWRKHRRAVHQYFYAGAIPRYLPIIKTYTQRYLVALSAPNPNLDEIVTECVIPFCQSFCKFI